MIPRYRLEYQFVSNDHIPSTYDLVEQEEVYGNVDRSARLRNSVAELVARNVLQSIRKA